LILGTIAIRALLRDPALAYRAKISRRVKEPPNPCRLVECLKVALIGVRTQDLAIGMRDLRK
jgi:hypothetical protein